MVLQEIASWYQKKIGTYDKQQWERTVEQRILNGFTHVPRKTAKLKTELIDVDLVRGSSFPKAKPKHGLLTVARLGIQRLVLLPAYWRWWILQTSPQFFVILVLLYMLQAFNMGLYYHNSYNQSEDAADNVSASEVFVPSCMMIVLSIIHSQIVCTHNGQPPEFHERSRRRVKRTMRRPLALSRMRKLNPETPAADESAKAVDSNEGGKLQKRSRVKRSTNDIGRSKERTGSEESCDGNPRVRVCFKEPTDEENSIGHEPQENIRSREGTPMDDDGFESLNGNGSSENGDELGDDNLDLISKNVSDQPKDSNKFPELLFLKCTDTRNIQKNSVDTSELPDSNNSFCCEESQSGGNDLSRPDCCEIFVDRECRTKLREQHVENEEMQESKPFRSDLNILTNENKNQSERDMVVVGRKGNDTLWPVEDVDQILSRSHVIKRRQSASHQTNHDSDSDDPCLEDNVSAKRRESLLKRRRGSQNLLLKCPPTADESSFNSSCCDDTEDCGDDEIISPGTAGSSCENHHLTEGGTSATDYMGVTTNSEECSYSSDVEESDSHVAPAELNDHPFAWEFEQSPAVILSPSCAASDKVSCTMWESRDVKKADLSVLDISSAIIARVEAMPENMDYFYLGMAFALLLSLVPPLCRLVLSSSVDSSISLKVSGSNNTLSLCGSELWVLFEHFKGWGCSFLNNAFGSEPWERTITIIALLERFALAELFFFLMAVAERTFKQRFLYAKLFSHLTSFRRARKSELPHFRLNKVRNIKTWLSVRSYLRKRGPQRSVDMLVSAAFIITLLLLTFLIVELLKDSVRLNSHYNMEALCWCLALGVFLLRFMTLGTDINRKYCNLSVLITEQINLYLQIEQKPNKKEELMVANSVLKLAADLLKELESPFKISGLSANPYLYNITNVVILSALSGVLSEILGFKLKLHKIKIK